MDLKKLLFFYASAILLYFAVYGFHLQFPGSMYFDEVYKVTTAQQITTLKSGYTEDTHPPLGMILMALSILSFGDQPVAWRLVSLLAGLGCIFTLYAIAKKITQNRRIAFFSAFLLGFDCISFTQARIGITNATMLFFMLLSIYCFMQHAVTGEWTRKKAFLLSGIFLGLGLATRWVAGTVVFLLLILYFRSLKKENSKRLVRDTLFFLVLTPALVYFSTFLSIPLIKDYDWSWIWECQTFMANFHLHLGKNHIYGSDWWTWPLMLRPIWFYFTIDKNFEWVNGILCIGNPLIFWPIPVALSYTLWKFWKEKSWVSGFVIAGFLSQWLPWAFVSRVKFFHYFYTAMPFVVMALALCLDKIWQTGKWGRTLVTAYLVLVAAMFVYWYPLLNGMTISGEYHRHHIWFKSWV